MRRPALSGWLRVALATGPIWLGLGACLSGLEQAPSGTRATPNPPESRIFRCGGESGARVRVTVDTARVALPRGLVALPSAVSASGARYSDGRATFWSKGEETRLELGDSTAASCTLLPKGDVWERARLRGVEFRAIGQEPGWVLEIDPERWIRLATDYGRADAYVPVPVPNADPVTGATTYHAVTEAHELRVVLEEKPCRDVMSGEAFPTVVTLHLNERRFSGCGMRLR